MGVSAVRKRPFIAYLVFILLTEAVGLLSSLLSGDSGSFYDQVARPALAPPGWLFPVVWAVLFALMGISAARVWLKEPGPARGRSLLVYALQLAVNFCWSPIFFNARAFGWALLTLLLLWVLIVWMIFAFRRVDRTAAWLQLPYLLWVSFAGYLNYMIWLLNS